MESWITTAQVLDRMQRSEPTLYRRIRAGKFPKPAEPGRWRESDVDAALGGGASANDNADPWNLDDDAKRDFEAAR